MLKITFSSNSLRAVHRLPWYCGLLSLLWLLLLPGQWEICLRFCQCFFDIVVWPGTRYNSLQVKTNGRSFELTYRVLTSRCPLIHMFNKGIEKSVDIPFLLYIAASHIPLLSSQGVHALNHAASFKRAISHNTILTFPISLHRVFTPRWLSNYMSKLCYLVLIFKALFAFI